MTVLPTEFTFKRQKQGKRDEKGECNQARSIYLQAGAIKQRSSEPLGARNSATRMQNPRHEVARVGLGWGSSANGNRGLWGRCGNTLLTRKVINKHVLNYLQLNEGTHATRVGTYRRS